MIREDIVEPISATMIAIRPPSLVTVVNLGPQGWIVTVSRDMILE